MYVKNKLKNNGTDLKISFTIETYIISERHGLYFIPVIPREREQGKNAKIASYAWLELMNNNTILDLFSY